MTTESGRGDAPFFIVGSGRSGTTLLRMILSRHSRIAIPPETWFYLELVKFLPLQRPLKRSEISQALDVMTSHYRWPDMKMAKETLRERAGQLRSPGLRDLVEIVYQEHLHREGKERWGDKTPPYVRIVPELRILYPDSKFIHLIRDGRDVTKSFFDLKWVGRWLYSNTMEWKEVTDLAQEYAKGPLRECICTVRYEDLVLQTERTVQDICNFLDESFEPQMLEWEQTVVEAVPEREARIHKKLFRKPSIKDVNRWKRELNGRQVFLVESFIASNLRVYRYDVKFQSPLWKPLFAITRWGCCLILPGADFFSRVGRFARRRIKEACKGTQSKPTVSRRL
ncbi:MAG: sulfotransferase [Saprospiraceae bacterium]|nr:sulfotransferase [Nitrospira sp.]